MALLGQATAVTIYGTSRPRAVSKDAMVLRPCGANQNAKSLRKQKQKQKRKSKSK